MGRWLGTARLHFGRQPTDEQWKDLLSCGQKGAVTKVDVAQGHTLAADFLLSKCPLHIEGLLDISMS